MKSPRNFSLSLQPPLRGTEWNVERQARLSTIYSTNCRLSKSQLFFDIHRNVGFALSPPIRSYHLYKAISLTWISSRSFAAFPPIGNFPWKKNIKVQRSLIRDPFFDIHRNFGFVLPLIRSYHLYKAISLTWISSRSFAAFPPIGNFPWNKNIKVQRSSMT